MRVAAVAARASRQRAEQVDLGEEFNEIARAHRARLHEVLVRVACEPGAHEDVEYVVNVMFGFAKRKTGVPREDACEVGMAAMAVFVPRGEKLRVGTAARANHVVYAATGWVEAVPGQRVARDRRHGPQTRKRAPEPVTGGHMRCVQRARLAREEALREIVRVPEIEIADLRALDADDAKDVSGRHAERAGLAPRTMVSEIFVSSRRTAS